LIRVAIAAVTVAGASVAVAAQLGASPAGAAGTSKIPPNASILSVSCWSTGACEAVGYAEETGDKLLTVAEVWDGKQWVVQATVSPSGGGGAMLTGVSCVSAKFCEAVGDDNAGNQAFPLIEDWNGTAWSTQAAVVPPGTTDDSLVDVSCWAADGCMAVGTQGAAKPKAMTELWNGTAWTAEATPEPTAVLHYLTGVSCPSSKHCLAVGYYQTSSFADRGLAEAWDGKVWTAHSVANPTGSHSFLSGVACASPDACAAVGYYTTTGSVRTPLAEGWNGSSWTLQPTATLTGGATGELSGVACATQGSCEAVGYSLVKSQKSASLAAVWGGTTWKVQTIPPAPGDASKDDAYAKAVSCHGSGSCEAVGMYYPPGRVVLDAVPLAEGWNGRAWVDQTIANGSNDR
jgi:hypothetical protein